MCWALRTIARCVRGRRRGHSSSCQPFMPADAAREPSNRHRPVQIRRIQAERTDHGDAKPGLLESGPALSRWHRVYDHTQPSTATLAFVAGKFDMDLPL